MVGDCGVLAWGAVCDSSLAVEVLLDGALGLGVSDGGVVSYVRVGPIKVWGPISKWSHMRGASCARFEVCFDVDSMRFWGRFHRNLRRS